MNNRILRTIVAALIALPLSFAVAEDEGKGERGKGKGRPGGKGGPGGFSPPKFGDIDTDASGDVDLEEWTAFQVKMAEQRAGKSFGFIAGDDEKISEEELKRMLARRGGPGGPKGGPGGDKGKGKGKGGGKRDEDAGGGTKPKRPEIEE